MENDMLKLSNMLNIKITKKKVRENTYNKNTVLSEKAIKNLLDFYKETDYKALQKLVDFNLIPKELFDLYLTYN
jgi:predicted transcriptional regulator